MTMKTLQTWGESVRCSCTCGRLRSYCPCQLSLQCCNTCVLALWLDIDLQAIPEYQLLSFERAAAPGGIAAGTSEPDRDHSRNTSAGAANVAGNPEPARRQMNTQELSEEGDEPVSPETQHEHKKQRTG